MKFLALVMCMALLGCSSMVRIVSKSEQQIALSYLPSHRTDANVLAEENCAKYGKRAEFSWASTVDDRVVSTWSCER